MFRYEKIQIEGKRFKAGETDVLLRGVPQGVKTRDGVVNEGAHQFGNLRYSFFEREAKMGHCLFDVAKSKKLRAQFNEVVMNMKILYYSA